MNAVIVAGVRTPFAKAGTVFKRFKAVDLGRQIARVLQVIG